MWYLNIEIRKTPKNDTFCELLVTSAQCIIGTEEHTDSGILSIYDDDDENSQRYAQIKEASRGLRKDDFLQQYNFHQVFGSSNDGICVRYILCVLPTRYETNFTAAQSIKVEFIDEGVVLANVNCYALILTNKLTPIISDG